jgi:lysophospholipid acyltransferase (LPLAT)-like uncharacterized protein
LASIWKIPWLRELRRRLRRPLQIAAAPVLANYIKLAINTSTVVSDPPDWLARAQELHPSIIALWHGQFLLLPGIYPPVIPGRAMIARHDDAEALARVLRRFGLGLIRGAGAGGRRRDRGGAEAAHGAVASLREKFSIAMTADIPPGPARRCGLGIVMIGSRSGRPIVPFAVATSRYRALNSWDRMTINLPLSKLGIVMGARLHLTCQLTFPSYRRGAVLSRHARLGHDLLYLLQHALHLLPETSAPTKTTARKRTRAPWPQWHGHCAAKAATTSIGWAVRS